jgi:putative transposase
LFQGRFKAILVDREAYLLSLCRYVELNPVAAHLVAHAVDWTWSSAQAHLGLTEAPPWLDTQGLHAFLLGRPVRSLEDRQLAIAQYADLLQQALDTSFWNQGLRQQVYLGSEAFVAAHQAELSTRQRQAPDVPRQQRQVFLTAGQALDAGLQAGLSRDEALYRAYTEAGCTMVDLAQALNLSVSRVSRIVAKVEATRAGGAGLTRP